MFELARLVGAGVVGGLIGSYATHWLTLRRERRHRKRKFRSFVVQFKSEAADRHYPSSSDFAKFYQNKVPALHYAATDVADDFRGKRCTKFVDLVSTAAGFTGREACEAHGKQRVIASLDAILGFLDT